MCCNLHDYKRIHKRTRNKLITIVGHKILIDGKEQTNAEIIGCATLDFTQNNTDLIIFEDE